MKKVNSLNISYMELREGFEGVENYLGNVNRVSYLPEKKNPGWKRSYPEGYYKKGEYFNPSGWSGDYKSVSQIYSTYYKVVNGSVFTLPVLSIFSGGKGIHQEVFQTFEDMELHVKQNYPKCSVTYN